MKSSNAEVKVQSKKMSRIGHASLLALMALSLSVGNPVMAAVDFKIWHTDSKALVKSFSDDASKKTELQTKAVSLFNDRKFEEFVKTWANEPKSMLDAWAAVMLDQMKKSGQSKLTDADKTALEAFRHANLDTAYGENAEGALKGEAYGKLLEKMYGLDKSQIENGDYLNLLKRSSVLADLSLALKEPKKEEPKPTPTKTPENPRVGEQVEPEQEGIDCDKLIDDMRKQFASMVKPLQDGFQQAMNALRNLQRQQTPEAQAQARRADQGDRALEEALGRLAQNLDNAARNQNDRGEGNRQQPPVAAAPAEEQPNQEQPLPTPNNPQPQEPQQAQAAPTQLVNADQNVDLKPLLNVRSTSDAIDAKLTDTKNKTKNADNLMASISQQSQMAQMMFGNNPTAMAMMRNQNLVKLQTAKAEIDNVTKTIDADVSNWSKKLRTAKDRIEAAKAEALNELGPTAKQTKANMKAMIDELDGRIKSAANNPQMQAAKAQWEAEKSQQQNLLKRQDEAVAQKLQERGLNLESMLGDVEEAEKMLNQLKGEKDSLASKTQALDTQINNETMALFGGFNQQPAVTRGSSLAQQPVGPVRPRTLNPGNMPSSFAGGGTQRLPLGAK